MDITSDLTEGSNLQPFLLLAKKSKGKAIVAIIQQTLNASNIYVFGELLEIPNVLQVINIIFFYDYFFFLKNKISFKKQKIKKF